VTPTPPPRADPARISQARGIAAGTSLLCVVAGVEATLSQAAEYHALGLALLGIVGVSALGAWLGSGHAQHMVRWLAALSLLQALVWGWMLWEKAVAPLGGSMLNGVLLLGWLAAAVWASGRGVRT
jgi:hypothetical protein